MPIRKIMLFVNLKGGVTMRQIIDRKPMNSGVLIVLIGIITFIIFLVNLLFGFLPKEVPSEFLMLTGMGIWLIGIILCAVINSTSNDVHHHSFVAPVLIEDAPTKSGDYTSYSYQMCSGCKTATIFDRDGYLSTTDKHKEWLEGELARHGITLIVDA